MPAQAPWRTMDDLLAAIDAAAVANAAVLVPQGNLRMMVVGHENRPATSTEISAMADLLGEALDAGAFGMSSGLTYTPGMYADTAELEALCRVVVERGGYWAPHTRSYGGAALEAYREGARDRTSDRLPGASHPRHHELRPEPGSRAGTAGPDSMRRSRTAWT